MTSSTPSHPVTPKATASGAVPRLDGHQRQGLLEAFIPYMMDNLPVIITGLAACSDYPEKANGSIDRKATTPGGTSGGPWRSLVEWVKSSDGTPDLDAMDRALGSAQVPVTECLGGDSEGGYGGQPKTTMTLSDYLCRWKEGKVHGPSGGLLYLKDWHVVREGGGWYITPEVFRQDWLNWWWEREGNKDDYRFCYMGPQGTSTPLHHDVLYSNSWSLNLCGRKHWLLFPPTTTPLLGHRLYGVKELPPDVLSADPKDYPDMHQALEQSIEVIQEAGEALFVPSGWHHQVTNLDDCISINHNWFNGYNLHYIWSFLQREAQEVRQRLQYCREGFGLVGEDDPVGEEWVVGREWDWHCEKIVRVNAGMGVNEMYRLLGARRRVEEEAMKAAKDEVYRDLHRFALTKIDVVLEEIMDPHQPYHCHIFPIWPPVPHDDKDQ